MNPEMIRAAIARHFPNEAVPPRLRAIMQICEEVEDPALVFRILINTKGVDAQNLMHEMLDTAILSIMRDEIGSAPAAKPSRSTPADRVLEKSQVQPAIDGAAQEILETYIFHAPIKGVYAEIDVLADGRFHIRPGAMISLHEQGSITVGVRDARRRHIPAPRSPKEKFWVSTFSIFMPTLRQAANFCLGGQIGILKIPTYAEFYSSNHDKVDPSQVVHDQPHKVPDNQVMGYLEHLLPGGRQVEDDLWTTKNGDVIIFLECEGSHRDKTRHTIRRAAFDVAREAHKRDCIAGIMLINTKDQGYYFISCGQLQMPVEGEPDNSSSNDEHDYACDDDLAISMRVNAKSLAFIYIGDQMLPSRLVRP